MSNQNIKKLIKEELLKIFLVFLVIIMAFFYIFWPDSSEKYEVVVKGIVIEIIPDKNIESWDYYKIRITSVLSNDTNVINFFKGTFLVINRKDDHYKIGEVTTEIREIPTEIISKTE